MTKLWFNNDWLTWGCWTCIAIGNRTVGVRASGGTASMGLVFEGLEWRYRQEVKINDANETATLSIQRV